MPQRFTEVLTSVSPLYVLLTLGRYFTDDFTHEHTWQGDVYTLGNQFCLPNIKI